MKEEFIKYLESIDVANAFWNKIEMIYEFFEEIYPDEITDIFIEDYIKEDGLREYESLLFFSKKNCMEAKQFITKEDFDVTPIEKRIFYWSIKKQNYDFKKATEKSRLHLIFHLDTGVTGEAKAAKNNCDYLREIILKYVVPNLKE